MNSPKQKQKIHFSINSFKKKPAFSSEFEIKEEHNNTHKLLRRSSSFVIPKRFVPRLKPKKPPINPTFFLLNKEKKIYKTDKKDENLETKSAKEILSNEDNLSISSISDSYIDSEEEEEEKKKEKDLKKGSSNNTRAKLNFKESKEENNDILLSSLFNVRRKLQQIKNNCCFKKIKENIDINLLDLKKKFRLEGIYPKEDKFENNIDNLYFKNYKNKFHTFKSSKFLYDNNNKTKTRPFLVFDVLSQASQNSNL